MIKNNTEIFENERIDDLHRNGLRIIQNKQQFCFGVDAVFLSNFCKVKKGENLIDLGTGSGILPILLSEKTNGNHFTGLEIQEKSVEIARRNIILNNLEKLVEIKHGDLTKIDEIYGRGSFSVVCSNPPYISKNSGLENIAEPLAIARHEIACNLDDIIRCASYLLKFGGRFYMVHRPDRLADILILLRHHKLEAKTLRFIHARIDKAPTLLLVEAMRGGNPSLIVKPPLIIYNENNEYTKETKNIYYN